MDPSAEQPLAPREMAPRRRRARLIVGVVAGILLLAGGGVAAFVALRPTPASNTSQPTMAPTTAAAVTPVATTPAATATSATTSAAPPSPVRTPGRTCSDSAAWEQQGGTELIDAYINNQGSGNIDVEDIKTGCPQYLPVWQKAQGGIPGGSSFAVPAEVKPGTYETTSSELEGCYWERSRNGDIVDNKFITASKVKQRVTIRSTDDTFVTRKCGNWIKVG